MIDRDPAVPGKRFALGLVVVAAFSTPLMVLQQTVLQQLDGGAPGLRGLVVVATIYAALVALGARKRSATLGDAARGPTDTRLLALVCINFATLALIMALFDPATHRSTSVHQTIGPCHVEAIDITGAKRFEFLCAEDFDEDFSFDGLDERPQDGARWYTVSGKAHRHFGLWMGGVAGLGLVGAALFALMLGRRPQRR